MVLLESAQAGIAVIASDAGGIPDLIISGENGTLKHATDVRGFVDALHEFTKDPKKRSRCGEKLRSRLDREFSFEQMIEKTIELYLPARLRASGAQVKGESLGDPN